MPLLSLDLNPPTVDGAPARLPPSGRYLRLTYSISRFWFPGRGLLFSLLVHEIAIVALIFIPPAAGHRSRVWREKQWETTWVPPEAIYLPQLGGGSEGGSGAKANSEAAPGSRGPSPAPATGSLGMTYPGKQQIISNPPNPTNTFQTILQPDLPKPPALKEFIPLPNQVIVAQVPPPPPPPVRVPEVTLDGPEPLEAPTLTLPTTPPAFSSPSLPQAPAPTPPAPPAPPQPAPETKPTPRPPLQEMALGESIKTHNLLVLSAVPAPPGVSPQVPPGEAQGQFAISPQASPDRLLSGIGTAAGINTPEAPGLGVSPGASVSPSAVALPGAAPGEGPGHRTGVPGETGNGPVGEKGGGPEGRGGGGRGVGVGPGIGPGAGQGPGAGHGPGIGAGAGPGPGPFAGMTIQGAEGPVGAITIPAARKSPDENQQPTHYAFTIISTGNSGGVGDFGVFHDEAVYTVYVDAASAGDDPAPLWPLQYAIQNPSEFGLYDPSPPFVLKKQTPVWPPDLLTRHAGQEIVVYAVIDTEGKMQQLKVLQTPDTRLSEVLLAVLEQWLFRPATMNGKPVAVKAVLGVRISSARREAVP